MSNKIRFNFHPYQFEQKNHTVEKADSTGRKRRYMCGVSSGLKMDAHGEKMSENCIKSFMEQSNSGDLLLFPDLHGIRESTDIGRLTKAEIQPNGDWYTEYALYDADDGIGPNKSETIDTLWKQINGLPPYTKPRQKGFSIEGIIPDGGSIQNNMGQGMLDNILLDGVVLVPRPAYKDSIATAVYKALGETTPERKESIINSLRDKIERQDVENNFYKLKWDYQDALETVISKIMTKNNTNQEDELGIVFDEYKDLMVSLILRSKKVFADEQSTFSEEPVTTSKGLSTKVEKYQELLMALKDYHKIVEAKHAE